jgi:hypothetical protein
MLTSKYNTQKSERVATSWLFPIILICLLLGSGFTAMSQDEFANEPVSGTFETGLIGEMQTTETPFQGEFEVHIQHRFGLIENGIEDVFGIYSSSNIRMGINYGITKDIMIGYGYTKDFKLQELHGKYRVFTQTESNSMPVSIALYGNLGIRSQNKEVFGDNYSFSDRLSYFSQLIIAHKFDDTFSLQLAPSFTHFNKTDTLVEHDKIAISVAGRAKVSPSVSLFFEYDQPLNIDDMREFKNSDETDPEANLTFGAEIGTSTHVFQVFLTNYAGITPQQNVLYNRNELGDLLFGFNILVRF